MFADLCFQERYLNCIQTTCPHLLRYLAVAIITNPRRRGLLKELVRVIGMERSSYSDPITQFIEDLYQRCDFEAAQLRLEDCARVIDNDFFLCNSEQDFLKNARLHIFENYCRIHERIDLRMLAQKCAPPLPAVFCAGLLAASSCSRRGPPVPVISCPVSCMHHLAAEH